MEQSIGESNETYKASELSCASYTNKKLEKKYTITLTSNMYDKLVNGDVDVLNYLKNKKKTL